MATLSLHAGASFASGNSIIRVGSRAGAYSITVDGYYERLNKSLATSTTWDAWESGSSAAVTDFDFLWLVSDQVVLVEFTADKGGEVGTVVFSQEAQAGIPLMLTSDDCMANYTANFATGTADVIDRIRVRNVSGSTAAIELLIVT